MAWKTILPGHELPEPKKDAKEAISFGSFRISGRAVYLTNREYLPLDAVQSARLYSSQMNTHGCCGLGLPVWYVLLFFGGEGPLKLLAESKEKAEKALFEITARNPAIVVMEPNK